MLFLTLTVQGWQGPTAAVGGRLMIVDFSDDYKVKAWEPEANVWQAVNGGDVRLPAEGHKPWAVQLVEYQGCLCLVLPDLTMVCVGLEALSSSKGEWEGEGETVEKGDGRGRGGERGRGRGGFQVRVIQPQRSANSRAPVDREPCITTSAVLGCQSLLL